MGVGRPPEGWDTADYVLGKWTPAESNEVPSMVAEASDVVEAVLRDGLEAAMNQFNTRRKAVNTAEMDGDTKLPEEQ